MAVNRKKKLENIKNAPIALPRLARKANKYHNKARKHWLGLAKNARKSGKALIKARYYGLWRRGGWKRWLEKNFDGSYETAKVYIRIAKKWDDPRLKEARRLGVELNSINKITEVLSGKRNTDGTLNVKPDMVSMARQGVREMFAEKIRTELSKDDIVVMTQEEVFDGLWDKFYTTVRKATCQALEFDPYEYENDDKFYRRYRDDERVKRKSRKKVNKALNKK